MKYTFSNIKKPFLFLDGSLILRTHNINTQKLTKKFQNKRPEVFAEIINKLNLQSETETAYYQQIVDLQYAGIISSLITFEIFHEKILMDSPEIILLSGQYSMDSTKESQIIFWEEPVNVKTYLSAASKILQASCIIADESFFTLNVGRSLQKYITNGCKLIILSNSIKKGDNHIEYGMPPKEFINFLHLQLRANP